MAASTFFIPSVNVIGADSLADAMNMMAEYGLRRTLIVTDSVNEIRYGGRCAKSTGRTQYF